MIKNKFFGFGKSDEGYADLHVHTDHSDSTFTTEEVVRNSKEKELRAIAITDHDSVDAIPFCLEEGKKFGVEIIPGIELTVEYGEYEVHILGYFVDYTSRKLIEKTRIIQKSRVDRVYRMAELMADKGIKLDPQMVFDLAGHGSVGRMHVAKVMVNTRQVRSFRDAFDNYIGHNKPCYVPHIKFTPAEAVDVILDAGGVPVMAHPVLLGDDKVIEEFVGHGLRGIEVYHTDHDRSAERKYLRFAKAHNLIVTGGSDCHGMGKGRMLIGTVKMKYEIVTRLKEEAEKIRKEGRMLG